MFANMLFTYRKLIKLIIIFSIATSFSFTSIFNTKKKDQLFIKVGKSSCSGCMNSLLSELSKNRIYSSYKIKILYPESEPIQKKLATSKFKDLMPFKYELDFVLDDNMLHSFGFKDWNPSPEILISSRSENIIVSYDSLFNGIEIRRSAILLLTKQNK